MTDYGHGKGCCCFRCASQLRADLATAREYAAACERTAVLNQRENVSLKTKLATVTAERDRAQAAMSCAGGRLILKSELDAERAAHTETRKSLEKAWKSVEKMERGCAVGEEVYDRQTAVLESTRAALTRSEAQIAAIRAEARRGKDAARGLVGRAHAETLASNWVSLWALLNTTT